MYEIEKKFILSGKEKKKLLEGAEFLAEKNIVDTYFDTPEFALTKNDIWLRCRDGIFELKLPMQKNGKGLANKYQEIEGEEKIRQIFAITPEKSFLEDIASFGYENFCICRTSRKEYAKGKFKIVLDKADFGDFQYEIAEIEAVVADEKNMQKASDEIFAFARSCGLKTENLRGKIIEYLFRKKPKHYKALVGEGVVVE